MTAVPLAAGTTVQARFVLDQFLVRAGTQEQRNGEEKTERGSGEGYFHGPKIATYSDGDLEAVDPWVQKCEGARV